MKINLYDFDGTIYDGDSTRDFYLFEIKNHPIVLLNLPYTILGGILYILHIINKTKMKEMFYRFLTYLEDVDKDIKLFWNENKSNIKGFYLNKNHSNDVIISASPEFLLEPICSYLKVKKLIASRVDKNTGKTTGLNCHDEEKVRRLNEVYKKYIVEESYSDSIKSDYPILKLAKKSYLVKKNKIILTDINN